MKDTRRWRWRNVPVPEVHSAIIVVGLVLNVLWPWPITSTVIVRWVGGSLVVLGVVLAAWATWTAGRVDLEHPEQLVTSGPYAVSRHPMYVAWTLIYLGVALVLKTWWFLVLLSIVGVLIDREARREETSLEEAFGEAYRTYRHRVRRYF